MDVPAGETARTRGDREVLLTTAEAPTAIALDSRRGLLYWGGADGQLSRCRLDGTEPTTLSADRAIRAARAAKAAKDQLLVSPTPSVRPNPPARAHDESSADCGPSLRAALAPMIGRRADALARQQPARRPICPGLAPAR
jgi:hypothetical protein